MRQTFLNRSPHFTNTPKGKNTPFSREDAKLSPRRLFPVGVVYSTNISVSHGMIWMVHGSIIRLSRFRSLKVESWSVYGLFHRLQTKQKRKMFKAPTARLSSERNYLRWGAPRLRFAENTFIYLFNRNASKCSLPQLFIFFFPDLENANEVTLPVTLSVRKRVFSVSPHISVQRRIRVDSEGGKHSDSVRLERFSKATCSKNAGENEIRGSRVLCSNKRPSMSYCCYDSASKYFSTKIVASFSPHPLIEKEREAEK